MPHSLVFGMTESGKTTLMKKLAAYYRAKGDGVLVLDPIMDDWNADLVTDNPEKFLKVFWGSRNCTAIIDEASETVGKYDDAMRATATRGRHQGHNCFYLSQRGADLNKTVRDQCRFLYLFTSSFRDAATMAEEFNADALRTANTLPQGHFYYIGRYQSAQKLRLW